MAEDDISLPRSSNALQAISTSDESELLSRLRSGDDSAFELVLREFGPRLLAVAKRIMANEADAQEAVQDGLLSAFKALNSFDANSKLSTWLHRIIVNACLMKLRSKNRRPELSLDPTLPLPSFSSNGHRNNPGPTWKPPTELSIEAQETRRIVQAAIDQLPEAYRVVLVLRDITGLDTDATAAALEVTPNAVKTRLHRARQALRELLDPYMRPA